MRIIVTAGPTREPIDSVRFLSNRSSGKLGYAIARALARRHDVTLVSGPTALAPPPGVTFVPVETARQMYREVVSRFARADVVIMNAAVADYRPARVRRGKIPKGDGPMHLTLVRNPDILAALGRRKKPAQVLVGFALEARKGLDRAWRKLREKNLDIIVCNDLSTMGSERADGAILERDGAVTPLAGLSKAALARLIEKFIGKARDDDDS